MERKTKHRILGVFVVIGLVIASLPLFQTGKDLPSEATLVKAPPFPEQPTQVTSNEPAIEAEAQPVPDIQPNPTPVADNTAVQLQTDDTIASDQTAKLNVQAPEIVNPEIVKPAAAVETQTETKIAEADNATKSETNTTEAMTPVKSEVKLTEAKTASKDIWAEEVKAQLSNKEEHITPVKMADSEKKLETLASTKHVAEEETKSVKKINTAWKTKKAIYLTKPTPAKLKRSSYTFAPTENNGLSQLKNPVWVIQIGSFKNKTNAVRLVNKVRAKGYSAFMQQVSVSANSSTRVFVGPKLKQAEARALASQLESEMRIRGIVISFKPFVM